MKLETTDGWFPASFGEKLSDGSIRCHLCPIECVIPIGQAGVCRFRHNANGQFYLTNFGQIVDAVIEPIEKKPLYHFYPGGKVLSIGSNGCNMGCTFCQNFEISQKTYPTTYYSGQDLVSKLQASQAIGLTYTFNEPLIWFEYIRETAPIVREAGYKIILNTNGLINQEPLRQLLPFIDALNLDLKGFSEEFYQKVCKAPLDPVLQTAKILHQENKHFEISHLVILGENEKETLPLGEWILNNLGRNHPIHINAYYPRYLMTHDSTPHQLIEKIVEEYRKMGHYYVYPGNVIQSKTIDTECQKCKKILISRQYIHILKNISQDGNCPDCGTFNFILQ